MVLPNKTYARRALKANREKIKSIRLTSSEKSPKIYSKSPENPVLSFIIVVVVKSIRVNFVPYNHIWNIWIRIKWKTWAEDLSEILMQRRLPAEAFLRFTPRRVVSWNLTLEKKSPRSYFGKKWNYFGNKFLFLGNFGKNSALEVA